jgi:hypothetical protein
VEGPYSAVPETKREEGDEGGPAQNVQDVNKKPYTFLLTFPISSLYYIDHKNFD